MWPDGFEYHKIHKTESDKHKLSFAISKPCGVKVKLQVKIVVTNPQSYCRECSIVWYHGEFTDRIFYWKPKVELNSSQFEQSVEVRTDTKSESGLVEGFLRTNFSPDRDPYNVFTSFRISRLVSRSLLCSYRRLKYKCVHLNNIWRSRITFFLKQLLDSPCGSKFILILLNLAPPSLSLRFSTPVRHSFNTPAYRGQSWWANVTERVLSL